MSTKNKKDILHVIANCNDLSKYIEAAKMILENPNLDHHAKKALEEYAENYNAKTSVGKQIRLRAKRMLAKKLQLLITA